MDNNQCNSHCKPGIKCIIPVLVVFAVIFVFEWLFHGVYMKPAYEATASMWRSPEAMQALWPICLITKLVTAAIIVCLYKWVAKGCASGGKCYKKGIKFGVKIGLLLGIQQFTNYLWLPIEMDMAVKWLIGNVIMGVLIGLVLATICRKCPMNSMGV
jgi:hypothetical protein